MPTADNSPTPSAAQPILGGQKLLVAIGIGIVFGIIGGAFLPGLMTTLRVDILGDLFLRSLRMIVVPLVVTSMITGVSQLGDVRHLGRTGGLAIGYYTVTTFLAVAIGLVLVNIVQPGIGAAAGDTIPDRVVGKTTSAEAILLSFVPNNIFEAAATTDILPLIVFSLLFGGVLTTMGEKGDFLIKVFDALNDAIMQIVHLVMVISPVGIFGLVAGKLAEMGGGSAVLGELAKVSWYSLTVMGGLVIHATLVLGSLLFFVARRPVLSYINGVGKAILTAFSTASSSATLPITIECVEEENGVSPRAASFVLPLGATVNMDGTALYEAVAALFIAQAYGIPLTFSEQIIVALTATLASIGAAGIPEAGLVTMVMVLEAVGLPLEGMATILVVDWFLDRCRTSVNVWGDSVGAAVVERLDAPPAIVP